MANMTIKSTYALDPETVRILERLARNWRVSKSEALRRAIRSTAGQGIHNEESALAALSQLQKSLRLKPVIARKWERRVRDERRSSSLRKESRNR